MIDYKKKYLKYKNKYLYTKRKYYGGSIRANDFDNYPDNPQYPRNEDGVVESCVGLLLIDQDPYSDRKIACIVEYNLDFVDNLVVIDSSGHASDGVVIGDFVVDKTDYGESVAKEGNMTLPEVNSEDLAF